jgi:hypothetical protein
VGDGTFPFADLYSTYREQMVEAGRDPVSSRTLARALSMCGQPHIVKTINKKNTRCRIVCEKYMASEEHDDRELNGR